MPAALNVHGRIRKQQYRLIGIRRLVVNYRVTFPWVRTVQINPDFFSAIIDLVVFAVPRGRRNLVLPNASAAQSHAIFAADPTAIGSDPGKTFCIIIDPYSIIYRRSAGFMRIYSQIIRANLAAFF